MTISVTSSGSFSIHSDQTGWMYQGNIAGRVIGITGPASGFDDNQVSTNGLFDEFKVYYSDNTGYLWLMRLRAYRALPSASHFLQPF